MDVTFDKSAMLKKVTHNNSEDQKKTSGVQQQVESTLKQVEFVKTISNLVSVNRLVVEEGVKEEEVLT